MLILYHGRFQPPHAGHIELVKYFLEKYEGSKIIISIDVRSKDKNNPFSFGFRKDIFEKELSSFGHRVIITSHKCKRFTFDGCLPPTYENAKKYGKVDVVAGGPDLPEEVVKYWEKNGIRVETVEDRFLSISSTEVRFLLKANRLGFSVITNFGCNENCWYCVWKNNHKLIDVKTSVSSTNWVKLRELIKWYPGGKVNISGGGDPLYDYENNRGWWTRLFKITKELNKLVDIHTRQTEISDEIVKNVNKLVLSFDKLQTIKKNIVNIPVENIRLVKVVTADTTLDELNEIISFGFQNGYQLTFKELYGFSDDNKFQKLRRELRRKTDLMRRKVRFLKQADYNVYFMPDNRLYSKFIP